MVRSLGSIVGSHTKGSLEINYGLLLSQLVLDYSLNSLQTVTGKCQAKTVNLAKN